MIRNLNSKINDSSIRTIFRDFRSLKEIIRIFNSNNVYLKFGSLEDLKSVMKRNLVAPFVCRKKRLNMCLVNKLPLDLNKKSKIVLVTVYNERIKINVFTFYHLFKSFGEISKIIIFKKKNYQVFVEFVSAEQAFVFKQALHNVNYKNYFFIKIQFTQKKELVVNSNTMFEYDFLKPEEVTSNSFSNNPSVSVDMVNSRLGWLILLNSCVGLVDCKWLLCV